MFKSLFNKNEKTENSKYDDNMLAVTAILVEAAYSDENFGKNEKDIIIKILKKQFTFEKNASAEDLVKKAVQSIQSSGDLITYTRTIKELWAIEKRIEIIEMMWKVCLIDGVIEPYEDMLIRRIAGLIYVSDKDRKLAKAKAINELKKA